MDRKAIDKLLDFKSIVRPKSLVITLMGDMVSMHGKSIWGGNLVEICDWFGITPHSSRISLQRLVGDGWLVKKKKRFLHIL